MKKVKTKVAANDSATLDTIARLRKQFGEDLVKGAKKCGNCGYEVVGMLKTPGYYDGRRGVEMPPIYEVGCIVCFSYWVDADDGTEVKIDGKSRKIKRRSYSARAITPEGAVKNWNEGNYVEDDKLSQNMPGPELARLG